MKFEVQKSSLLEALQIVSFAVPNKSTLQILNNFLLSLEGNTLTICATDLDIGIKYSLEVNGMVNGSIVTNASMLLNVVKALEELPTTFVVDNYQVNIESPSGYTGKMTGFDSVEFPQLTQVENQKSFNLTPGELQFLSEKTAFAVSNDITRMSLNGVFCQQDENQLVFVATDGHRLGKVHLELDGTTWDEGVIIPPKALNCVTKTIKSDQMMDVTIDHSHISFSSENVQVVSKLLEGPYPNYNNVIPSKFEKYGIFDRMEAMAKINRIAAMAHARTKQIKLHFDNTTMEISTQNLESGAASSQEPLAVEFSGDEPFDIGFNSQYLLEILKCVLQIKSS